MRGRCYRRSTSSHMLRTPGLAFLPYGCDSHIWACALSQGLYCARERDLFLKANSSTKVFCGTADVSSEEAARRRQKPQAQRSSGIEGNKG